MSITRLQQARQMYAMGQRVGRAFGGVMGSDGRRQYGGGSDMGTVGTDGKQGGKSSNTGLSGGYQGGPAGGGPDDKSSDTQQYNHYEATNQYNPMKEDMLPGDIPDGFIKPEDAGVLGLNLRPYEQRRVDFLNAPYQPVNFPPYIPGGMLLNTVGNFIAGIGNNRNKQFFADNVAGKYGYDYDPTQTGSYEKAYERYMKDRMSGKVGAYGNENMGQNSINALAAQGDSTQGVMNIDVSDMTDDTTTDDFFSRYLQNQPDDIREEIEARMQNYYTV